MGAKFPGKMRYVALEWHLVNRFNNDHFATTVTDEVDTDIDTFPSLFRFYLTLIRGTFMYLTCSN